jgi:hypothetical protein
MEVLICLMIALISFATYLGWPVLTNSVDSDGPAGSVGGGSG